MQIYTFIPFHFSWIYLFNSTHIDYFFLFLSKQVWTETIFGVATESEDIISEIRSISRPNNQIYRTCGIEVVGKTLAISESRLPRRLSATLVNAFTRTSSRESRTNRNCAMGTRCGEASLSSKQNSVCKERLFAIKKKKKRTNFRINKYACRQISRGTSSTAPLCDALFVHASDASLRSLREFSVQMTITQ